MITVIAVVISLLKSQHKILACFNFRKHFSTLFDLKSTSNEISCRLHGIRGAVMLSILIFHSITTQAITVDSNSESYRTNSDGGNYVQMNLCGSVVEAFFVIGAILVTRSMLRDLRRWAHEWIQICECLYYGDQNSSSPVETTITSETWSIDTFVLLQRSFSWCWVVEHSIRFWRNPTIAMTLHAKLGGNLSYLYKQQLWTHQKMAGWVFTVWMQKQIEK